MDSIVTILCELTKIIGDPEITFISIMKQIYIARRKIKILQLNFRGNDNKEFGIHNKIMKLWSLHGKLEESFGKVKKGNKVINNSQIIIFEIS